MLDRVHDIPGRVFDRPAYHADRRRTEQEMPGIVWKLERSQKFREPYDPSWQALVEGRWHDAIALHEKDREHARSTHQRNRKNGVELRRLRIVERPVTPYLQWETHFFKILVEEGYALRVLEAEHVRHLERTRPLPELLVHGDQVLYEVCYDAEGTPSGARRIDDPDVVAPVQHELTLLWAKGEPFMDYFKREITPLPAPRVAPVR
jgi:hypothetical protein